MSAVLLVCVGAALTQATRSSLAVFTQSAALRTPSFAGPTRYATARFPDAVAIGDLNGDGKPDLVIASTHASDAVSHVSVLLNRGGGRFRTDRAYRTGLQSSSVAAGDLNGDGKLDLATANLAGDTVSVLINRGDGGFLTRTDYATGSRPSDVAIGDLNGDGRPDLVTANSTVPFGGSVSSVSVFLNNGDGSFQDRVDHRTGRGAVSVAIGDLNGDGKPDAVTANISDTVSVFINGGDGDFRPRIDHRAGSGPRSIAIGDLNGDRKPDLVTANSNTTPRGRAVDSVSVLLNRGDGSFRAKLDYGTSKTGVPQRFAFVSVAVGDLNRDGKQDVAIGNDRNTVSVLVNRGEGRLRPRLDYGSGSSESGSSARSIAIGDLNHDRKLDLVTVNLASVSVLLNTTHD